MYAYLVKFPQSKSIVVYKEGINLGYIQIIRDQTVFFCFLALVSSAGFNERYLRLANSRFQQSSQHTPPHAIESYVTQMKNKEADGQIL